MKLHACHSSWSVCYYQCYIHLHVHTLMDAVPLINNLFYVYKIIYCVMVILWHIKCCYSYIHIYIIIIIYICVGNALTRLHCNVAKSNQLSRCLCRTLQH